MTRKKQSPQTDESESKPFSRKDFINSVIKKKVKNKFGIFIFSEIINILFLSTNEKFKVVPSQKLSKFKKLSNK